MTKDQKALSDAYAEIRRRSVDKDFMRGVKACAKGESFRDGMPHEWYEGYAEQYAKQKGGLDE